MRKSVVIALILVTHGATGPAAADETPSATLQSPIELAAEARAAITRIAPAELDSRLQAEPKPLLVDVRTEREYQAGHLRGARWIPRGKLEFAVGKMDVPADREMVLYCRTGGRAALAAQALQEMGYTNVTSLEGGFKQWVQDDRSIYNQHGEIRVVEFEAGEEAER